MKYLKSPSIPLMLIVAVNLALSSGCGTEENSEASSISESFQKSKVTWQSSSSELYGNSYQYTRVTGGPFTGSQTTSVEVRYGVVYSRSYSHTDLDETIVETWEETSDIIGQNETGFEAKTMDQLYDECESDVISKVGDSNYSITFETDEDGILNRCIADILSVADGGSLECISQAFKETMSFTSDIVKTFSLVSL